MLLGPWVRPLHHTSPSELSVKKRVTLSEDHQAYSTEMENDTTRFFHQRGTHKKSLQSCTAQRPYLTLSAREDRLVWPSGRASASRAEGPRFESRLRRDFFFRGRVIPVTQKLTLQWLPCQAPGVIGSALGLVCPVSVYCDWVR